jgi:D-tyrosyl-tRNA(Tyr) deacylase
MIGLLQRVTQARVEVAGETVGAIGAGLLVLVAVEPEDTELHADRLLERILGYRVFPDESGRMNLSLRDSGGGLLLVSQFTLAADTKKGMRASFTRAATPELGARLYAYLVGQARNAYPRVASGRFGAAMQVSVTNDGPVTFWLQT